MESKKVYVHYEGTPEYTHVAKITWGLTAEELAVEFTRVYNAKHGRMVSLDPATIHLLNGRRRITKSANLIRLVKDRSDIFVERELPSIAGSVPPVEETFSFTESNVKQEAVVPPEPLVEAEPVSGDTGPLELIQPQALLPETLVEAELFSEVRRLMRLDQEMDASSLQQFLMKALEAQHYKDYKLAGNIFREILKVVPKQKICLRGLGSMALAVDNFLEALPWLQHGVEYYPSDELFHARLGDAYFGLGNYKEALTEYDCALGLVEEKSVEVANMNRRAFPNQIRSSGLGLNPFDPRECCQEADYEQGSVDDPSAGDLQGPVTAVGLKISSAGIFAKLGDKEFASTILTETFDSSEQQLIAAGDRNRSLNNSNSLPLSIPFLSFADDVLMLYVNPALSRLQFLALPGSS